MSARKFARFALLVGGLGLCGCASIGPGTVARDRVDYVTAVAESWKEQTLLNIVRLRYADTPSFLEIASVIGSYGVQGQVTAGGAVSSNLTQTVPWSSAALSANAAYIDRPTISYTPLTGSKFARNLLRPIPPLAVFELIQAGYPADRILAMTTRALNGIYNQSSVGLRARPADPEFYPLLQAIRRVQILGSVTIRLDERHPDEVGALIISARKTSEVERDLRYILMTLRLQPGNDGAIDIGAGALPRSGHELAILTRSMIEILQEVGSGIDVPKSDIEAGRATASPFRLASPAGDERPLISIRSGAARPDHAFVAVQYHGTWYWIDDGDYGSKGVFTFLMIFFSLAEAGNPAQAPVLTLPLN